MAISKLILNGEVQMDVTSNTNAANNMLNGVVGTKNDGTSVTGNIASKSSSDLTVSGATVTAPAGYYANAASKAVATTTHPNPTASIVSSTGVVTASHTQGTGYVTSGTTTGTLNLTTQAATTYYPSTADQTISSYRWLKGTQTIKSVTTSNLTAENIAEGVVVKVGDSSNASRITQITGTHSSAAKHTATIISAGVANWDYGIICMVRYNDVNYYTLNSTFEFSAGDNLLCRLQQYSGNVVSVYVDGEQVASGTSTASPYDYNYILPDCDINISLSTNGASIYIISPFIEITENGKYEVDGYRYANVEVSSDGGYTADQIAMRTISGAISGNATTIGAYAFDSCWSLTAASFPLCTSIGISAFCTCRNLTSISFPLCLTIGASAFYSCSSLTIANFPSCTSIGTYAFAYCSSLTTASFPSCISTSSWVFRACNNLTTAIFPLCKFLSMATFYSCHYLTNISFPLCSVIGSSAFYSCSSLTTVSFPSCTSIGTYAFAYCHRLLSLYLLGSSVPTLSTNVFYSTPITGHTTLTSGVYGSIFVPSSLYNSYITATNWSVLSDRIVSM